jgi:hypothetical protein
MKICSSFIKNNCSPSIPLGQVKEIILSVGALSQEKKKLSQMEGQLQGKIHLLETSNNRGRVGFVHPLKHLLQYFLLPRLIMDFVIKAIQNADGYITF